MLITKRPGNRLGAPILNPSLPRGSLVFALNASLNALGTQTSYGSLVAGTGPTGQGFRSSGSSWFSIIPDGYGSTGWIAQNPHLRSPWTCICVCYPDGIGTDVCRSIAGNVLGSSEKGWWLSYDNRSAVSSPNKAALFVARGAAGEPSLTTTFGPTLSAGQRLVVAVTLDASNVIAYANGGGAQYAWSYAAATGVATREMHVGRSNYTSTLLPFVGLIESIAFIPQKMSEAWVQKASIDPYAVLFGVRRIPIPTASAGATLPTLSASTYVPGSLTSTGWRPRVTATY